MSALLAFGLMAGSFEQAPEAQFDLTLLTEMRYGDGPGGRNTWATRPIAKGRSVRMLTHSIPNSCGFSAGSIAGIEPGSAIGWQLDAMPLEVTNDHVVVRLHWSREMELGKRTGNEFQEVQVLLRPGDSLPLDTFVLPEVPGGCKSPVATLVASLSAREPLRTRVTSTDLWLVHKAPGGKETTQHINVRGELNTPIPFFFDEERVGSATLDVFGRLTLRPKPGGVLSLEFGAQRMLVGEYDLNSSHFGNRGGGKIATQVNPDDVTEFAMPSGTGPEWQAFTGHSFAIRVRSRLLR